VTTPRRLAPVVKLIESCNLACSYCYQEDLLGRRRVMSEATLTRIVSELARIRSGPLQILWFGGEPTLVGRRAFERAVDIAEAHLSAGGVRHAIQTNATLIDDAWAALLARHRFTVTVSLDGFEALHDHHRKAPSGRGTHALTMAGSAALKRAGITPRASCVLTPHALPHAEALVDWFAEAGFWEADFPPAGRFVGGRYELLVTPEQYGEFMVRVFDRWLALGRTDFRIRSLSGAVRGLSGRAPSYCKFEASCSQYATFGYDGRVYPCDEFSGQPEYLLGDVLTQPLDDILSTPLAQTLHKTWTATPAACLSCEWVGVCRGGCPFERQMGGGADGRTVLCEGFKKVFTRVAGELGVKAAPRRETAEAFASMHR